MKIGLLSDNHGYLDDQIKSHLTDVDEIWHAGDIGDISIIDRLSELAPVVAVYGNIDNHITRSEFPENQILQRHGMTFLIRHIAGRIERYNMGTRELLAQGKFDALICGHSHILKVQYDKRYQLLYINPGACGHHGFHHVRTLITFHIDEGKIHTMNAIELGKRGAIEQ